MLPNRVMDKLEGRTALVTGAASGLGAALTDVLAECGMKVAALDQTAVDPSQLRAPDQVRGWRVSVTDPEHLREITREIETQLGPIDLVFNNAGIDQTAPFERFDDEAWRQIVEVNLLGAMDVVRTVYPGMRARGRGRIINIASAAGAIGFPFGAPYTASKAGLIGFSKALHAEARPAGVHIGVVQCGFIETPLLVQTNETGGTARARYIRAIPGRRLNPHSAARAIIRAGFQKRCVTSLPRELAVGLWMLNAVPGLSGLVRRQLAELYDAC